MFRLFGVFIRLDQFILCFVLTFRFVNALVYFGLSLNVKNLAGDMYLNFFILIIIELPSALLAWFCLQR